MGEHPRKFLLRVDQMIKDLERVGRPVDPKDIDIVILSGLTPQNDAEVRMLESSSNWPTWEWVERAAINQYEWMECEKSAAGSRAMLSARGHRRNDTPPTRCSLCSRTGHSALKCRELQITRCEKKSNGYQRDGEHAGTAEAAATVEAAETAEVVEMVEVAKAAEWAAIVEEVSRRKVARIPNPAIRPLPPCYFCLKPHRASECPNRSASTTAPATPNSQHGGYLGSVRTNLGSGLLVATSARPALAARGAPRERH